MTAFISGPVRRFFSELATIVHRFRQVWALVPSYQRWALSGALSIMALTSVCATGVPLLIGQLVDGVKVGLESGQGGNALFVSSLWLLAAVAVCVLIRESLQVVRRFLVEGVCTRTDKELGVRVVGHLMKTDLASFTHEKLGALHGRIFRSVDGAVVYLRLGFLDFIPALLTGAMALTVASYKQPWIGLVMICVIPISICLTAWQLFSQKEVRMRLIRNREELDATIVEQLSGLDYVRVAHTHEREVQRFANAAEKRRAGEFKHHIVMSFFGCGKALTEGFFHLSVLGLAVLLAVNGQLSTGDIFLFSMLFLSVMTPLSEVHRVIDVGHEAGIRVGDLIGILNQPVDKSFQTVDQPDREIDDHAPVLSIAGLTVAYAAPDGQTRRVLDSLNLEVYRGETIGIAGRSGCGKTTLLKVLMRLMHPTSGTAEVRGVPLTDVSREEVSRLIGYVGQSPFVFAGTIEDNIAYGCPNISPEAVRRAAKSACLHDEIMQMPDGYKTMVAERGANLSGGQRQRVALARVFLKDPPILILDEATSALDNISERHVQRAIDAARVDRTVILVAHRLSTFAEADRILVVDRGRVVESGTFNELVQLGGVFHELVMSADPNPPASPQVADAPAPTKARHKPVAAR